MSLAQARAALTDSANRDGSRDRLLSTIGRCPALGEVWAEFAVNAMLPDHGGDPGTDITHLASPDLISFFSEEWGNDHLNSEHPWPQPPSTPDALAAWAGAMRGIKGRSTLARAWEESLLTSAPRWVDRSPESYEDPWAGKPHCAAFFNTRRGRTASS